MKRLTIDLALGRCAEWRTFQTWLTKMFVASYILSKHSKYLVLSLYLLFCEK